MCHRRIDTTGDGEASGAQLMCFLTQVPPPARHYPPTTKTLCFHGYASSAAIRIPLLRRTHTSPNWLPNWCHRLITASAGLKPHPKWKTSAPTANFTGCSVHLQVDCILLLESQLTCTINIKPSPFGNQVSLFPENSIHQTNHFQTHPLYYM